jgi:hypothetical protein
MPIDATPFDIPAEDCGFPIHVGVVDAKAYNVQTREAPDGSRTSRITGRLFLSFTNPDTGKTIVRNVGGPPWFTVNPDGSLFLRNQGHTVGNNSPADQATTGLPGLFFVTGDLIGHFAAGGSAQSVTVSGRVEDGCALLA